MQMLSCRDIDRSDRSHSISKIQTIVQDSSTLSGFWEHVYVQDKIRSCDSEFCLSELQRELYEMFHAVLDGKIKHSDIVPLLAEMVSKMV